MTKFKIKNEKISNICWLLTPWCRVLLEKITGLQLVKKFPAFHGTRRFITALTSVRHFSLSWASPIQSIYPHPTSWRSILILSTHLRLGLPSGLLTYGFPSKTLYTPFSSPTRATCPAHFILLDLITCTILDEDYKLDSSVGPNIFLNIFFSNTEFCIKLPNGLLDINILQNKFGYTEISTQHKQLQKPYFPCCTTA